MKELQKCSAESEEEGQTLELQVHAEESVAWAQLSHLREWSSDASHIRLVVPPLVDQSRVVDTVRMVPSFPCATRLTISVLSSHWHVSQPVLGAAAELLGLHKLVVEGGHLQGESLSLHVLTGLKALRELRLRPFEGAGLGDAGVVDGLACLTSLESLEFRGCKDTLTDEGVRSLSALTGLRELSLKPLGSRVTEEGVSAMCEPLAHLTRVDLGCTSPAQVDVCKGVVAARPSVKLGITVGEQVSPSQLSQVMTTCTLCLADSLTRLHLASVKAEDSVFMVAVGALHHLTHLSLTVAPARLTTPGMRLNLGALTQLTALQSLEVATVGPRVLMPISVSLATQLLSSWPHLAALSLSCMVRPQRLGTSTGAPQQQQQPQQAGPRWRGPLQPDALQLLSSFPHLQRLALFAPLPGGISEEEAGPLSSADVSDYEEEDAEEEQPEGQGQQTGSSGQPEAGSTDPRLTSGKEAAGAVQQQHQAIKSSTSNDGQLRVSIGWLPQGLQELVLERALLVAPGSSSQANRAAAAGLRHLSSVELQRCKATDEVMLSLLAAAPNLTRLELSEVRGISGATIKGLCSLTRLQHLEVSTDNQEEPQEEDEAAGASGPHRTSSSSSGNRSSAQQLKPSDSGSGSGSWWSWLTGWDGQAPSANGSGADQGGPQRSFKRRGSKIPLPRLTNADFLHLRDAHLLRWLSWSLPSPLGLPSRAQAPGGPQAAAPPPTQPPAKQGSAGAPAGGVEVAAVAAHAAPPPPSAAAQVADTLSALRELQVLCVHAVRDEDVGPLPARNRLPSRTLSSSGSGTLSSKERHGLGAGGNMSGSAGSTAALAPIPAAGPGVAISATPTAAGVPAKGIAPGPGDTEGGLVPKWILSAGLPHTCKVLPHAPVACFNVWTEATYYDC